MAPAVPRQIYAAIRRRLSSYCAEVFLLFAGVLLLQGILFALGLNPLVRGAQAGTGFSKVAYHLWLLGTVDLPLVVYYTGTLASSGQATLVMRWLGLRLEVVKCASFEQRRGVDGGQICYGQAFLRTVVMLIPFEVSPYLSGVGQRPSGHPYVTPASVYGLSATGRPVHHDGFAFSLAAEHP